MTSTTPVRPCSTDLHRAAAGTALAAASALSSLWLVGRGLQLFAEDLCFEACPSPTHGSQGSALVLAGLAVAIAGLIGAPRTARSDHPWLRTFGAIPVSLVVGMFCIAFGARRAPGLTNVAALLAVSAGIAVVVPPRGRAWFGGLATGCLMVAAFRQSIWISLVLGLGALVGASHLDGSPRGDATDSLRVRADQ